MAGYATDAGVQALDTKFTDAIVLADGVIALSVIHANPEIDARLAHRGAPWTSSPPALVVQVASLLIAAMIRGRRFSQDDDESNLSAAWRKTAERLLIGMETGKINPSGMTVDDVLAISDPESDRPKTEVFTSDDETDWESRTEARES